MFIRKIGKILRGKATPFQLMMAAVLGAMLGFIPGFSQGLGLIIALTLLLIVLNANLAAAAIVGLLGKLASLALLPASFAVGEFLLDGPTQPLFTSMINAPVLALFGFEYYATTGGLVLGLLFGLICGTIIIKLVASFRRKMADLETNSERFNAFASKKWVKVLAFIFIGGGKGKRTYADLMQKKVGNPIRLAGAVFAVLFLGLLVIVQMYFSGPIITMWLKHGLEQANGATVDLKNVELDLAGGSLVITGLAMADPNALGSDIFRAARMEAEISSTDLLRKRARIDRLSITDASSGEKRQFPGRLIRKPLPSPPPPPDPAIGDKTLDEYLADAKLWHERLAQVRHWMEKVIGSEDVDESPLEKRESLKQRIQRQIDESGYANVRAAHLIQNSPTLVIGEMIAQGVRTTQLEGEVLDVAAKNISTHPRLLDQSPELSIKSRSKSINLLVRMNEASADGQQGKTKANRLRLTYAGLPPSMVSKALAVKGAPSPIEGGTIDVDIRGGFRAGGGSHLNLPLHVTVRNSTITIPKAGAQKVEELKLTMGMRGPIDNPRISVDQKMLADALAAAGAAKLASHVRSEADKAIGKVADKATQQITGKIDKAVGDKLPGQLPGAKSPENILGEPDKILGETAKDAIDSLLPKKKNR